MEEQSKGIKILYTVFLVVITTRTIIAIYDRFVPPKTEYDDKKNKSLQPTK